MTSPPLFGLLNIYKPRDWTSRDVVNRVERLVKPAKAGHAGTLDPLAEGVLVVGVGAATRLMSAVQESQKVYVATFELGCHSDTDDRTGKIVVLDNSHQPHLAELSAAIPRYVGDIWQTPPQFSAVHVAGERAYAMARQGQTVELQPRLIHVSRIEIRSYSWPHLELEIECGSGTYIRSLGRDLGRQLGCGAIMTELTRTRIGPFLAADAISVENLSRESVGEHLQSATRAVEHWPKHLCTASELRDIVHGRMIETKLGVPEGTRCSILSPDGSLAACAEMRSLNRLAPTAVFAHREPSIDSE